MIYIFPNLYERGRPVPVSHGIGEGSMMRRLREAQKEDARNAVVNENYVLQELALQK